MKQILLSAYIVIMVLLLSACVRGGKTSSALSNGDTLVFRLSRFLVGIAI